MGTVPDGTVPATTLSLGAARARWPNRSSKPVRRGSPTLGRFDSGAAPLSRIRAIRAVLARGRIGDLIPVFSTGPTECASLRPLRVLPENLPREVDVAAGRLVVGVS